MKSKAQLTQLFTSPLLFIGTLEALVLACMDSTGDDDDGDVSEPFDFSDERNADTMIKFFEVSSLLRSPSPYTIGCCIPAQLTLSVSLGFSRSSIERPMLKYRQHRLLLRYQP